MNKALLGLLDWQLDPQQAAGLPNFGSRNAGTEVEAGLASRHWSASWRPGATRSRQ